MRKQILSSILVAAIALLATATALAQNRLVNIVPNNRSGETNQDSEPTIAVDPNNFDRIVGSAFTWDNLTASPNTTNTAPVFVSTDRGATWTLTFIVPSLLGAGFPTGDINISFSSTVSGAANGTSWLYGGILSSTASPRPMIVLRAQDPYGAALMTQLSNRTGNVDQPHATALTSFWDGQDRVYVGFNNGFSCVPANGRTATLDVTQNGKVAAPTMTLDLIEARNNACQNGFAQVAAPHLDGTVYAAFIHDWCGSCATPRMTVVRDDSWGQGGSPFTALTDPSDMVAGRFIAPTMTLASGFMGQNRLGASNVAIAVDPRDSDRVYVAWGDRGGANSETIHVRRSTDRGATWSAADLLNVTNAMNPQIAINSMGTVGVLYQRVVSNRWETHLVRTTNADGTTFDTPGLLLADQSSITPVASFNPYIGDYASLVAAGKNFFGMFSASNFPDTANFLPGVQYQREVDWSTNQLFTNAAHTTTVSPSIDPFFFEIDTVAAQDDFYVRDWTTDATHADNGVEPSTGLNFYSFSDVWNRRGTSPGAFVNDQPSNEDAGNGVGNIGDNWAFARVRRNTTGPVTSVTAHFLVSRFGTGGNYVDATTLDPNVTFPDPDPAITTDGSAGPWITDPYHWHLNATAGNHLCLAVEISTAGDPYIPPTLEGSTPGWSTGTDLRIINDNNKAQRNMHLSTTPATGGSGSVTDWAIVHNPGYVTRDIPLQLGIEGITKRYVREVTVQTFVGRETIRLNAKNTNRFVLKAVQPGENRWVSVTMQTAGLPRGASAFVAIDEISDKQVAGGFAVGVRSDTLEQAIKDSLFTQRVVLTRLESRYSTVHGEDSDEYYSSVDMSAEAFVAFVHDRFLPRLRKGLKRVGGPIAGDPFNIHGTLAAAVKDETAVGLVSALASLLNGVDAQLTHSQLQNGDVADIVQMVSWQKQLYQRQPALAKLSCAKSLIAASTEFVQGRQSRKLTNAVYPRLLETVHKCLREGIETQTGSTHASDIFESKDLAKLEKEHRALLLLLAR